MNRDMSAGFEWLASPALVRSACLAVLGLIVMLGISCVNLREERGVEQRWGDAAASEARWKRGVTTRSEILSQLGVPSQVTGVGDETVYYYLREHVRGKGIITIVYNHKRVETNYDRAIFFFDRRGRLADFAVSTPPADSNE